jgi:hypothetical protein
VNRKQTGGSLLRFAGSLLVCGAIFSQAALAQSYQLVYLDGHMHTTHSDGSGSIADLKTVAHARGLSALIVTNHTKQIVDVNEWNAIVSDCRTLSDPNFLLIPSFEVTGSEGGLLRDHVLAWGVYDPFVGDDADAMAPEEVWPSPRNASGTGPLYPENIRAWTDYIHANGGMAVHAHTWGTTQPGYNVDFIEVYNVSTVKDIVSQAKAATGGMISEEMAYQLGLVINNFAVSGDRDLNMTLDLPGMGQVPLQLAIYQATGQWLGAPQSIPLHSWDEQLMAYVNGTAVKPVFGVAQSDAHNTANTDLSNTNPLYDASDVGEAKNGVLVESLDAQSVLAALKAGRFFATTSPSLTFEVNGMLMGQTAYVKPGQALQIHLTGNAQSKTAVFAKVEIIKNGQVLKTIAPMTPNFEITIEDAGVTAGYYRAQLTTVDAVTKAYQFAWANPVFVRLR